MSPNKSTIWGKKKISLKVLNEAQDDCSETRTAWLMKVDGPLKLPSYIKKLFNMYKNHKIRIISYYHIKIDQILLWPAWKKCLETFISCHGPHGNFPPIFSGLFLSFFFSSSWPPLLKSPDSNPMEKVNLFRSLLES